MKWMQIKKTRWSKGLIRHFQKTIRLQQLIAAAIVSNNHHNPKILPRLLRRWRVLISRLRMEVDRRVKLIQRCKEGRCLQLRKWRKASILRRSRYLRGQQARWRRMLQWWVRGHRAQLSQGDKQEYNKTTWTETKLKQQMNNINKN